jgi:hypothetical protein
MNQRKPHIYLQSGLNAMLDVRGTVNVSGAINSFADRYQEMVRRNMPAFQEEEFVEIFKSMKGHVFTGNKPALEVFFLRDNLRTNGVRVEILEKIETLSFEGKMSLIDMIERSQGA